MKSYCSTISMESSTLSAICPRPLNPYQRPSSKPGLINAHDNGRLTKVVRHEAATGEHFVTGTTASAASEIVGVQANTAIQETWFLPVINLIFWINFAFAVKFFWLNLTTNQNPANRSWRGLMRSWLKPLHGTETTQAKHQPNPKGILLAMRRGRLR